MKNHNTLLLLIFFVFSSDAVLSQDKLYLTNIGDNPRTDSADNSSEYWYQ